jgi:hypothetical protein
MSSATDPVAAVVSTAAMMSAGEAALEPSPFPPSPPHPKRIRPERAAER